jgi:hypothetical protein
MQQSNKVYDYLRTRLPPQMFPGNTGNEKQVVWPFWFTLEFDFGTNPVYGVATNQTQSFPVTQEAGLLLMAISRDSDSHTSAGSLAPLQLTFKDRQSSRQLNSEPLPLQNLGLNYRPTIFPTPYWLNPMAFLDVQMTSWLRENSVGNVGNGKIFLTFFGYRKRTPDGAANLSTVFSV